jgi:hypothetical protein
MEMRTLVRRMEEVDLIESQYELSQFWFGRGKSYVSSMKCRGRKPSIEALLYLSRQIEMMAKTFSKSDILGIRNRVGPMRKIIDAINDEIDTRLL